MNNKKLKIAWISSYLPRSCGIAYYSVDYIEEIKKFNKHLDIKVISHTDGKEADYPIIDLKNPAWPEKVFNKIKKIKANLVHIQHEYGLYDSPPKNTKLLQLIKKLKKAKIPTVITYHSILAKIPADQKPFVKKSMKLADAKILHCEYQKEALPKNIKFIPKNVYVIPHGSREDIKLDKHKCKSIFNYPGKNVVGMAGLASERKGFDRVISLWPEISKKLKNTLLLIELKPHIAQESIETISKISLLVSTNKAKDSMELIIKDYGREEFYQKLKSFDILVLPYLSESQSGVLAHAFATHTPAVVTDIEGLGYEIKKSKAGIAVKNDKELKNAIINLMKNPRLRKKMEENAKKYVKYYSGWSIIARKTLEIYQDILE